MRLRAFFGSAACAAMLAGCSTAIRHGDIVEVDSTVFGVNVAATTSASETPAVQLGLIRQRVLFIPTSTNGPVYGPKYSTSGQLNNTAPLMQFGGQDNSKVGP